MQEFWIQVTYQHISQRISYQWHLQIFILGERAKEKDKDKHSSTSSVSSKSSISSAGTTNGGSNQNGKTEPTWVHDIFEGILTNETRCLCCETVSPCYKSFLTCEYAKCNEQVIAGGDIYMQIFTTSFLSFLPSSLPSFLPPSG